MIHEINKPTETLYVCVLNPIIGKTEFTEVSTEQVLTSGQPFLVFSTDEQTTIDLVKIPDTDDLREIKWLTGYNLEQATGVRDAVNANVSFMLINYLKIAGEGSYIIPYNEYIFEQIPPGDFKDQLSANIQAKVAGGYLKNLSDITVEM